MTRFFRLIATLSLLIASTNLVGHAAEKESIWEALRTPGHIALMRHALAPGTGDPAGFQLGDCSTQRNLSASGRAQARHIGDRFRENGISEAAIFTSQWCRCKETAELLDLGPVEELHALNSFFGRYAEEAPRIEAMTQWLESAELTRPTIWVTHQVNITALTDIFPVSGEIVVLRVEDDGGLEVLGTLKTAAK